MKNALNILLLWHYPDKSADSQIMQDILEEIGIYAICTNLESLENVV